MDTWWPKCKGSFQPSPAPIAAGTGQQGETFEAHLLLSVWRCLCARLLLCCQSTGWHNPCKDCADVVVVLVVHFIIYEQNILHLFTTFNIYDTKTFLNFTLSGILLLLGIDGGKHLQSESRMGGGRELLNVIGKSKILGLLIRQKTKQTSGRPKNISPYEDLGNSSKFGTY